MPSARKPISTDLHNLKLEINPGQRCRFSHSSREQRYYTANGCGLAAACSSRFHLGFRGVALAGGFLPGMCASVAYFDNFSYGAEP